MTTTLLKRSDFIGRLCKEVDLREFVIKETVDQADREVPRHTHEDAHFLLIVDGVYITSATRVAGQCLSSTLIFNPAGTTHRDRFKTRGGRFFTVSLKYEFFARPDDGVRLLDRSVGVSDAEVSWLGSRLYRELQTAEGGSTLMMEGLTFELVASFVRQQTVTAKAPPRPLRLAFEMIQDRYTETLTVAEIATEVEMHPVYLVRSFRKHFQMTIGEYQRKLRVQFACREIATGRRQLSEIALVAGFYDQSHFDRTFKQMVGMTPTEYRAISRP